MKRTTFVRGVVMAGAIVGATLMSANVLSAQASAVQVGGEVGALVSNIVGSDDADFNTRKAPYGGLSLVVQQPTSRIGFQTGLLVMPKGATSDFGNAKATFGINYVEVPLLLRLGMPLQSSKIVPTLLLGGTVGIKMSCKIKAESGSQSASSDCDDASGADIDVKTMDVGLSGGVEVAIPVGTRFFLAPTFRYTRGLTSIADGGDDAAKPKNSAFQLGAAFRIRM